MPTTPLDGFPYPAPTAPVSAGAADIQALAAAVEAAGFWHADKTLLPAGQVFTIIGGSVSVSLNSSGEAVIPIGHAFSASPGVIVSNGDSSVAPGLPFSTRPFDAANFVLHVHTATAGALVRVNFLAFGYT